MRENTEIKITKNAGNYRNRNLSKSAGKYINQNHKKVWEIVKIKIHDWYT